MKRFLATAILTLAAAVALAFSICSRAFEVAASAAKAIVVGPPLHVEPESQALTTRPFVQARAFVGRILKRERPTVTQSWRLVPST